MMDVDSGGSVIDSSFTSLLLYVLAATLHSCGYVVRPPVCMNALGATVIYSEMS